GVPTDESNLVWKALDRLALHIPLSYPALDVEIHKQIPAAGGMAGGSADAAAALMLAQKLYATFFELEIASADILQEIAADLGSDVPFTMMGGTALGKGRGEVLSPMLTRGEYHWCFIASAQGLSTPAVFKKLDEMREASASAGDGSLTPTLDVTDTAQALVSGDAHRLAKVLKNDLQPAALSLRPDLRKTMEVGMEAGALTGIVSGSGPTIAFYAKTQPKPKRYAAKSPSKFPRRAATSQAHQHPGFGSTRGNGARIDD